MRYGPCSRRDGNDDRRRLLISRPVCSGLRRGVKPFQAAFQAVPSAVAARRVSRAPRPGACCCGSSSGEQTDQRPRPFRDVNDYVMRSAPSIYISILSHRPRLCVRRWAFRSMYCRCKVSIHGADGELIICRSDTHVSVFSITMPYLVRHQFLSSLFQGVNPGLYIIIA